MSDFDTNDQIITANLLALSRKIETGDFKFSAREDANREEEDVEDEEEREKDLKTKKGRRKLRKDIAKDEEEQEEEIDEEKDKEHTDGKYAAYEQRLTKMSDHVRDVTENVRKLSEQFAEFSRKKGK